MLFVDHPEDFRGLMPGFLPLPLPGSMAHQEGLAPRPACPILVENLVKAVCGAAPELFEKGESRDTVMPGLWDWWLLASRAAESQYDILRRAIDQDGPLPGRVVCLALEGAGFHGQQERRWAVVRGNLHLTVGLPCDLEAASCGLALTMLPAVAVVDALGALDEGSSRLPGVGIKWVNDVLIQGRKVGGVLTSARSVDGQIQSVVLGIGLNVAVAPKIEPTAFTPGVTCLEDHIPMGGKGLGTILAAVLEALARRFEELASRGPEPLLAAYCQASVILGRQVEVRQEDGSARKGRVLGIGPDLALTLADSSLPVTAGRLILLPGDRP